MGDRGRCVRLGAADPAPGQLEEPGRALYDCFFAVFDPKKIDKRKTPGRAVKSGGSEKTTVAFVRIAHERSTPGKMTGIFCGQRLHKDTSYRAVKNAAKK